MERDHLPPIREAPEEVPKLEREQILVRLFVGGLVLTRQPDGSWLMTSRAWNDGTEGGSSKLLTQINFATAPWATLGLSRLVRRKAP